MPLTPTRQVSPPGIPPPEPGARYASAFPTVTRVPDVHVRLHLLGVAAVARQKKQRQLLDFRAKSGQQRQTLAADPVQVFQKHDQRLLLALEDVLDDGEQSLLTGLWVNGWGIR